MKNKWIEHNLVKWNVYYKDWYSKNPDKIKDYQKEHSKQIKKYYLEWVAKNKDRYAQKRAEWYQKNKELVKQKVSEYQKNNREKVSIRRLKYKITYPERLSAQLVVKKLIKLGILVKSPCEKCGEVKSEAHHEDYTKPEKIIWLCRLHHAEADKKRRLL